MIMGDNKYEFSVELLEANDYGCNISDRGLYISLQYQTFPNRTPDSPVPSASPDATRSGDHSPHHTHHKKHHHKHHHDHHGHHHGSSKGHGSGKGHGGHEARHTESGHLEHRRSHHHRTHPIHIATSSYRPITPIVSSQSDVRHNRLEDQMNNDHLRKLQQIFEDADEDGGGGLDIDEFRHAMRKTMGDVNDHELKIVFMKVDTNCDGTVDWDEYLSYMLLEYQERDIMKSLSNESPFPKGIREIHSSHRDLIVSVEFWPTLTNRHGSSAEEAEGGRYFTMSKEGVINTWTSEMNHMRSITLDQDKEKSTSMWLIDMVTMPNVNMVATSSTENEVWFFDVTANKFERQYRLTGLSHCVLCMDFWYNHRNMNSCILLFGDSGGNVVALVFSEAMAFGLFGVTTSKRSGPRRISLPAITAGQYKGVKSYKFTGVHDDWVWMVKFNQTLDCFLSCSATDSNSMFLCDLERKKTCSVFKVRKGITCFDYCPELNIIVTGGMDRSVRIWNPYVTTKATCVLKGHATNVIHIAMDSANAQIISVSKDKNVKVWDVQDQACVQNIANRNFHLGFHTISSICFNPRSLTLILATTQLAVLEHSSEEDEGDEIPTSHEKPICAALYNNLFNYVVSACHGSRVSVWNLNTGEKEMQFLNAHKVVERGIEKPIEITAMTFDSTRRRLLTGARDGSVKIWNFNNGACLRQLEATDAEEVTGIVCPKRLIVTAGWGRSISTYLDSNEHVDFKRWPPRHKDDILSVDSYGTSLVATSSYDGDILVWSIETAHILNRYNHMEGTVNLHRGAVRFGRTARFKTFESPNPDAGNVSDEENPVTESKSKQDLSRHTSRISKKYSSKLLMSSRSSNINSTPSSKFSSKTKTSGDSKRKNGSKSSSLFLDNVTYEDFTRQHEASVDKLLFLSTRDIDIETATLLASGAGGMVRAWSIHQQGGLLGEFKAAHADDDSVPCMATDEENIYLITGDSSGYIKVWDIGEYCLKSSERPRMRVKREKAANEQKFPFLIPDMRSFIEREERMKRIAAQRDLDTTGLTPVMVNSFRAHCRAITHLCFIEEKKLILSSSADCTVRLWTLCGRYIGTFGQRYCWNLELPANPTRNTRRMPIDVQRVASANTLKVLNAGGRPRWRLAKNILMIITRHKSFVNVEVGEGDDDVGETSKAQDERGTASAQRHHSERRVSLDLSKITDMTQWTSNILGKSYQPKSRHKTLPELPKMRQGQNTVSVYSSLPCSSLDPIPDVKPPDMMLQIQQRMMPLMNSDPADFFARSRKRNTKSQKISKSLQRTQHLIRMMHQPNKKSTADITLAKITETK